MAASFPGAEEGVSYGTPAFRVGKRLFLRLHGEEDAIVVMLNSVEEQQALIADEPARFYITEHYAGYGAVLVRATIDEPSFREIMESAWRRVARKKDLAAYEAR
jgi:hypothetical protein